MLHTRPPYVKDMNFQYIFIDCPAGIDVGFVNAISGANEAIIVTTPEITSIRDADRVAGLLEVGVGAASSSTPGLETIETTTRFQNLIVKRT